LRTLERLRPVKMALEATVRLWRSAARAELLAGAVKASQREQPGVYLLGERCAERLHIAPPTIYVALNDRSRAAHTLGTEDECYVVLSGGLTAAGGRQGRDGRVHDQAPFGTRNLTLNRPCANSAVWPVPSRDGC